MGKNWKVFGFALPLPFSKRSRSSEHYRLPLPRFGDTWLVEGNRLPLPRFGKTDGKLPLRLSGERQETGARGLQSLSKENDYPLGYLLDYPPLSMVS